MFLFMFFLLLVGAFIIASGFIGVIIAAIVVDVLVFIQIVRLIFFRKKN